MYKQFYRSLQFIHNFSTVLKKNIYGSLMESSHRFKERSIRYIYIYKQKKRSRTHKDKKHITKNMITI